MSNELLPSQGKESPYKIVRPDQALTVEWVPRHYKMYGLNENELDTLSSSSSTTPYVFSGICFGVFGSFLSVILSGPMTGDIRFAAYLAVVITTGLLGAYFLVIGRQNEAKDKHNREQIKCGNIVE